MIIGAKPRRGASVRMSYWLAGWLAGCVAGSEGPTGPLTPAEPPPGLKADLFPEGIEAPSEIAVDSILGMTVEVRNGGTGSVAPGWVVRVLLSSDAVIDSADIEIDHFAVPRELPAGAEDRYLRHKKLRHSTTPGPYYIGSILDVTEVVPETSEANNTLRSPAAIFLTPKRSRPPGDQ